MSLTFEYVLVPKRHRPERRPPPVTKRPLHGGREHVAKLLALGHRIQDLYEAGDLRDFHEAGIRLNRAQSRISQLVQLTQLAPDIQERVLSGALKIAEIHLRKALDSADWEEQRAFIQKYEHDHHAREQEALHAPQ